MSEFDPVSWETIEAVTGSPAAEVIEYVERADEIDETPSVAVKTIYDTWKADLGDDRTVPDQGAAFVIAYVLERNGDIALDEGDDHGIRALTDRRPSSERLYELFWEREQTMWWIATQVGVHWVLVQYWLCEDEIPLMERNFRKESMEQIRQYRSYRCD